MPFFIVKKKLLKLEVDAVFYLTLSKSTKESNTTGKLEIKKRLTNLYDVNLNLSDQKPAKQEFLDAYASLFFWAWENNLTSIAFSPISTFTQDGDFRVALEAVKVFLQEKDLDIYLVDNKHVKTNSTNPYIPKVFKFIYSSLIKELNIDRDVKDADFDSVFLSQSDKFYMKSEMICSCMPDDFEKEEGFVQTLFKMIDEKKLNEVYVYKKANIDRRLFSKMKSNNDYQPSKITAISFALALELDFEKTQYLLNKAGYVLSKSNLFDLIIEYFIRHKIYDLYEINEVLYHFDQKTIGTSE
ncbi:MAG: hypothetical protein AB7T03_06415 [Bacilli bacterium]